AVPGATVNFTISSGSASLGSSTATTDSSGNASTTVTAGAQTGPVVITASASTFSVNINLTVQPKGPNLTVASFTNAHSGVRGLVPCGLGAATGSGITSGFTLTINNVPAPIQSVNTAGAQPQAIFQTPCETSSGVATVVATSGGASTTITGVPVLAIKPGLQ